MNHNSYITVKRAKFKTISGEVNIPYGTKLEVGGNVLLYNGKPVCAVFSDCAYEFFAQTTMDKGFCVENSFKPSSLHLQSMMRHIRTDGIRFGMILAASSTSAVIVMISGFGTTISIMLKSKI